MTRERLIARRKALGYTQQSLAHLLSCERTTVARWERDECAVSPHHREPLAAALKWTLSELDLALNGSGVPHAEHGWWSNYEALEQSATSIRTWEPMLVPGLLQTRDYASALLDSDDLVSRRIDRQRMVTRPRDPTPLAAVLDESALHRPIGGETVLQTQLRHLATMTERPNITIQVLPLTAPAQAISLGAVGSPVILGFPWPGGLVYLEHRGGATYLDSPHDLQTHTLAFTRLQEFALSPQDSVDLISNRARELDT